MFDWSDEKDASLRQERGIGFQEIVYEKELVEDEDLLLERAVTITDTERECLQAAARNTLNKDKRINIRISSRDLNVLRRMANRFGMPYQTLVSSVLHRYVSGDLDDARFERGKADETSA